MAAAANLDTLVAEARAGDKRATGRLISIVENDDAGAVSLLRQVYGASRSAWITGLTGAPGAGKSTLADMMVGAWRQAGRKVAVLAVDPTSPFTGGALLGDRIRMQLGAADTEVLVRSMATRGRLGGLSGSTERVAMLCAGLGYEEVLIETVGVGQSEVDVAAAADTTVVVVTPGWGDGVQVAKAGVMEIGDIFVVNKADRGGTADTTREITEMLRLTSGGWMPPVVATVATSGDGLEELMEAMSEHRGYLTSATGNVARAKRRANDLRRAVVDVIGARADAALSGEVGKRLQASVAAGDVDPWSAAAELLDLG